MADPGFERGKKCRCGHLHFAAKCCVQWDCACKQFVDPRTKAQAERAQIAAGLPPLAAIESTVQRCARCQEPIIWGIHNGRPEPLNHPPVRVLLPIRRQGTRFLVSAGDAYTSHQLTCKETDAYKGRAGHESGPD